MSRSLRGRSACHLMHGHQAISTRFWPLLHTMWPMMGNLVCALVDSIGIIIFKHCSLPEELLIDFRELTGERIWQSQFGQHWSYTVLLERQVSHPQPSNMFLTHFQIIALIMDNASNNNTLMTSLKWQCQQWGIPFLVQDACMYCMPHTIHLATIKVLHKILISVVIASDL